MRALASISCFVLLLGCASGHSRTPDAGPPPRDAGGALDAFVPPLDDAAAPADAGGGPCDGVDCSSLDGPCVVGTCDSSDGSCDAVTLADGASCDDGDACTSGDACAAGACAGTEMDCSALDSACGTGACADGSCAIVPVVDGTSCDDGNACTTADVCASGACGGTSVSCVALDDACNTGVCDPSSGGCVAVPAFEGADCDDGDACTSGDVCASGACAGTPISGCGGGVLVPGRTDLVAGRDGWSVRCLAWSGRRCMHLQGRMECSVCPAYADCGVWHDVTDFNDHDNRSSMSWCALATGDGTVVTKGASGTAVAPRGCGWGSTTHPHCESTRASFHVPVPTVPSNFGALLQESYCSASTTLLNLECAGW